MPEPEPRPLLPVPPELRQAIVAGVLLGVVAAAVVWWLERFETRRVIGEVERYLHNHVAFEDYWRRTRGETP